MPNPGKKVRLTQAKQNTPRPGTHIPLAPLPGFSAGGVSATGFDTATLQFAGENHFYSITFMFPTTATLSASYFFVQSELGS
jgi:hypothetical protein